MLCPVHFLLAYQHLVSSSFVQLSFPPSLPFLSVLISVNAHFSFSLHEDGQAFLWSRLIPRVKVQYWHPWEWDKARRDILGGAGEARRGYRKLESVQQEHSLHFTPFQFPPLCLLFSAGITSVPRHGESKPCYALGIHDPSSSIHLVLPSPSFSLAPYIPVFLLFFLHPLCSSLQLFAPSLLFASFFFTFSVSVPSGLRPRLCLV